MRSFFSRRAGLRLLALVAVIVASAGVGVASAGFSTWEPRAAYAPTWRDIGLTPPLATTVGDRLYAVAFGQNISRSGIVGVAEYDPTTNAWQYPTDPQSGREEAGVASLGARIYAVGGQSVFCMANRGCAWDIFRDVRAFDTSTRTWQDVAPLGTARTGVGAGALGGKLYAVGGQFVSCDALGCTFTRYDLVEAYDPSTNSWQPRAPLPSARTGVQVAALNGKLYAVGGQTPGPGVQLELLEYDPGQNAWRGRAALPAGREGTLAVGAGRLYLIGGKLDNVVTARVDVYDPVANQWSSGTPLPTPRQQVGAASLGGRLYAVGGDTGNFSYVGTVEALDLPRRLNAADVNGDGRADLGVWVPRNGLWFALQSGDNQSFLNYAGGPGQIPVAGDYNGDGRADAGIFAPNGAVWYIRLTGGGTINVNLGAGGANQMPAPADYDGDGKTDLAVRVPGNGFLLVQKSSGGWLSNIIGSPTSVPVPADYDGDGKADLAVWEPSSGLWFALKSSGGTFVNYAGGPGQIPVPGDYNGDGFDDAGVFDPAGNVWYIRFTGGGTMNLTLGAVGASQVPVPADYDGDGKTDLAVWVPDNGFYLIQKSTGGFLHNIIGDATSVPLAKRPGYPGSYPYGPSRPTTTGGR